MPRIRAVAPWVAAVALTLFVTPSRAADDPVVATVGDTQIHLSEVARTQQLLPDPYRTYPLQMIYPNLLEMVIGRRIAAEEARKEGLQNDATVKETMTWLEEGVLQRVLMERYIDKQVTDEMLKARYEKMVAEMPKTDMVHARHILVDTEAEAKTIIEELKKGADFAKLAEEKSTGPSKSKGGDLGYFGEGEMVPEFSKAAFALKPGEFTQAPVQTQFGWHVIKVEDRKPAEAPSFEDSKAKLHAQAAEEVGSAYMEKLRGSMTVEKFNMDGTPLAPESSSPIKPAPAQ